MNSVLLVFDLRQYIERPNSDRDTTNRSSGLDVMGYEKTRRQAHYALAFWSQETGGLEALTEPDQAAVPDSDPGSHRSFESAQGDPRKGRPSGPLSQSPC